RHHQPSPTHSSSPLTHSSTTHRPQPTLSPYTTLFRSMKTQELKYVTRRRAAVLLGLSEMELSRISSESGFGHKEVAGEQEETYFTYEELRQICMLAVHQVH